MIKNLWISAVLLIFMILISSCGGGGDGGSEENTGSSHPNFFTPLGDKLIFIASEKNEYEEPALWVSDGTEAGTIKLSDRVIFPDSTDKLRPMVSLGDHVFFLHPDAQDNRNLWVTNGTLAGTRLFSDKPIFDRTFLASDDKIFFLVDAGINGSELWQANQQGSAFEFIKIIGPESRFDLFLGTSSNELYFHELDSSCLMSACSTLWKTDGTVAGTLVIKEGLDLFRPGHAFTGFVNGLFYFYADDEVNNSNAIWISDGTALGTQVLKMDSGQVDGFGRTISLGHRFQQTFVPMNGETFFIFGEQLWKTDGTDAGTVVVKDFQVVGFQNVRYLTFAIGSLYLVSDTIRFSEIVLWKSDGTEAGTVETNQRTQGTRIYALTPAENILFFKKDNNFKFSLWKTDGTSAGTDQIVNRVGPSAADEYYVPSNDTAAIGDKLYFAANIDDDGEELWVSDGTVEGTFMVKDINQSAPPIDD